MKLAEKLSCRPITVATQRLSHIIILQINYKLIQVKKVIILGEKDSAKLTVVNTPAATGANISYLFIISQNGITDFLVTNDNKYEFTFEEKDAPNYTLSAASFNGKFYQESQKDAMIRFNYKLNSLKVDVQTDKQEYKPREEVKLTVRVKDVNDQVNISVVDEAYFVLFSQNSYPLENLCQPF